MVLLLLWNYVSYEIQFSGSQNLVLELKPVCYVILILNNENFATTLEKGDVGEGRNLCVSIYEWYKWQPKIWQFLLARISGGG